MECHREVWPSGCAELCGSKFSKEQAQKLHKSDFISCTEHFMVAKEEHAAIGVGPLLPNESGNSCCTLKPMKIVVGCLS